MKKSQDSTIRTRKQIVHLLKQNGTMDADTLAAQLDITAMAVRQHLYALQEEQLVTYQEEARPMGRPAKLWQLTTAADRFFPSGYAELSLSLINSVKAAFGEAGLDRLLEVRAGEQVANYAQRLKKARSLKGRLQALAELRTAEGYMAEVQSQTDGTFLLIENHCPICAAATACTGLCTKELETFQAVLGKDVTIQRTEHIVAGARRCAYQICPPVKSE
ncbi:MAG: metalloregulator ArsR/SmtB family transcription factor [Leptolyngbyaceae cyanobacterium bins.302]|nr:metalloregulator ArsR/SmtB family transcription factor [Leptolyngbyaceae cyanobacterium bins.302]